MFHARHNARLKELTDLIETECDLGKVADLLVELNHLLDEETKPSTVIIGRSHSCADTSGEMPH